ncbi:YbaB/EbfC family nucleoid-associated protein [Actinosynnema sp. NPDC023587]|uniref:YbaB/EbfC family nucleoid-associated protein n=1 Tax=Actinosynnema sp. NPDC023587 TaxID=3154695 RepID=UPI0033E27B56
MSVPTGFGEPARDPDEAEARMSTWARGFAEKAARYREVGERTEALRLTASSPDGAVRVTVRADGGLVDLEFGDRARSVPLDRLSGLVMATVRQAQAGIADRVAEVMSDGLGDEDSRTRALVVDNLRTRFPDTEDTGDTGDTGVAAENTPAAGRDTAPADDEEHRPW